MALKTYQGFTHHQRLKALRWVNEQYRLGLRSRPTKCERCGATKGKIEARSEDYSEPFGPHIGQHALCRRCHLAVHRNT